MEVKHCKDGLIMLSDVSQALEARDIHEILEEFGVNLDDQGYRVLTIVQDDDEFLCSWCFVPPELWRKNNDG